MTAIDDKYRQLDKANVKLGAPRGPESDAGSGGRMRAYQNGNIYWHPNTGAHEVHGAVLSVYDRMGGPGANPKTGRRELGYPTTDEHRTSDNKYPISVFEWGSISWVSGRGAGVVHGKLYERWQSHGGSEGALGHPICEQTTIPGG
ncbi:MAG: hypothetical protein KC457_12830, partial [Myxococcales bacterium]|nr:hypothetical protein [Myxococcales bacterium]